MHLTDSDIRLYRDGVYPPLRGTFLQTSARSGVLYTKGSVPFFETYPGMYVPRPVSIKIAAGDQTPSAHAKEILALTKMNWNSTQFDGGMPLTLTAAHGVGSVLKHCERIRGSSLVIASTCDTNSGLVSWPESVSTYLVGTPEAGLTHVTERWSRARVQAT